MPSQTIAPPRNWTSGLTSYHWLVLAVASMGWLFDTMDQWLYVQAKGPALTDILPVGADMGYYNRIVQMWFIIGWATGGFLFGIVGDRLGRTRTMALTVLIYAGFTGLCGLVQNWQQFAAARFMTGLGVGGEFAAGAALVAEVFPAHARTAALGVMQAMSAVGNMMAGGIYLVVAMMAPAHGWRWVFAVGILPALLVFVIRLYVKEPERWQHAKDEAKSTRKELGSIAELFRDPHLRKVTLLCVGLAAITIIGFWGIATYTSELLRSVLNPTNDPALKGMVERAVSQSVIAQNAGAFFGSLFFAWLAQRVGRKPSFVVALLLCAAMAPATFHLTRSFTHAMILFPLLGFSLLMMLGGFAVYFPEIYPTRLRATGIGFCYNVARYITAATLFLQARFSFKGVSIAVGCMFLLGLLLLIPLPETRNKPLPE